MGFEAVAREEVLVDKGMRWGKEVILVIVIEKVGFL